MLIRRRLGLTLSPIFFVLVLLVSGCAAASGPDDAGGGKPTETRREEPAPPTTRMPASAEPPGSTLSSGGETVDGGLGGYCWYVRGGGGTCVDALGVSLERGALEAPAGATLSFAYKGRALDSLSVAAYRAGREGEDAGRDDVFVMPSKGEGAKDLRVRRSGTRARIAADLPAGEYVLDARARMPEGDASYGFRLILKPRDPGGP